MSIQKGDFIKISYTGRRADDGSVFDTTDEEIAKANNIFSENRKYGDIVVIAGAGHTVAGLDEDFIGKEVGYRGSVTIPPEKAFGHRNPELIENIPVKNFSEPPKVGMTVQFGNRIGTVIRVLGRMAQVDFNRYLAGQTVTYDYEIKEKIEDIEKKVKGIIELYLGKEYPVQIKNNTAVVEIEPELTFYQGWLISKRRIAKDIIYNTDIEEVTYLERYNKNVLETGK